MQLIQARIKFAARNYTTRRGERSNIVAIASGEDITIWGPANHGPFLKLCKGDEVLLTKDSKGSYRLVDEGGELVQTTPAITTPKADAPPAIAGYLAQQGALYRECYLTAMATMNDLVQSEESLRAIATTLYLQATKRLGDQAAVAQEWVAPVYR